MTYPRRPNSKPILFCFLALPSILLYLLGLYEIGVIAPISQVGNKAQRVEKRCPRFPS